MKSWNILNFDDLKYEILRTDDETLSVLDDNETYSSAYTRIQIPKRNSSEKRIIYVLNENSIIYRLQENLYINFFVNLYFPNNVFGFRKHYSYFDYLRVHTSSSKSVNYLRLDIKDFFDNISIGQTIDCLQYYISDNVRLRKEIK